MIAANIVVGLATVAFGWVDHKIGLKKVIILSPSAMVVADSGSFSSTQRALVFGILA